MSIKVPSTNTVTLAGRLVRDPEIKYLATNNNAVANVTVVNTQYYRDSQGKTAERTAFIRVVCWGPLAERIAERCKKGDPVIVEGRLETNQWDDRETGKKRSATQINANRVDQLTWGDDNPQGGQQQAQQQQHSGGYNHPDPTGRAASQPPQQAAPQQYQDDIPF